MFPERKNFERLFLTILLLWSGAVFSFFSAQAETVDIKPYDDGFVIARSDGMLFFTDIEGTAADSIKIRSEIAGIAVSGSDVLAVAPDGRVTSVERDGKSRILCRSLNVSGSMEGIACFDGKVFILSSQGILMSTSDWRSFTTFDFNSTYSGYYEYVRFTSICASDNVIFLAGVFDDGMPAVFTSAAGNIWSERILYYNEGRNVLMLEQQPLGLGYDPRTDVFVLACTDGCLFFMPGCSNCNYIERKAMHDLNAVAFNSGRLIFR